MEAKNMNHKTLDAKFTAGDGITKFTATITTSSIDRDGEVVVPGGMNSKQFEQNPVLLYAHDPAKHIGKMTALRRGESVIDADFALVPRPESHEGEWFPDTVGALMRFGALKGVSIGFAPMAGGMRQATKGDKDKYGVGVARVYSKWNLIEVSVVSVPANQEALINAVSKGIVTTESLKALGCEVQAKNCGTGGDGFEPGNDCASGGGGGGGGGGGSSSQKPSAPKLNNTQRVRGKPPAPGLDAPKSHDFQLPKTPGRINEDQFRDSLGAMGYTEVARRQSLDRNVPTKVTIRDQSGHDVEMPMHDLVRSIYANHTDPDTSAINVPARRPRKHVISIQMPSVAHDEIIDIARREVAKMRGHFKV